MVGAGGDELPAKKADTEGYGVPQEQHLPSLFPDPKTVFG